MEYIVIFNAGRDAAKAGAPRVAPLEMDYPVRSNYHAPRIERVALDIHAQREWLRGHDHFSIRNW